MAWFRKEYDIVYTFLREKEYQATYGNNCTLSKYEQKKNQYPAHYTANRTAQYKKDIANKQVCVDCIGLTLIAQLKSL